MEPRLARAGAVVLLASSGVAATPAPTATPAAPEATPTVIDGATGPLPAPTPASRVTRQLRNRRLDLPAYARFGTDPFASTDTLPAFAETVQVLGKPMDTQSLTAKMNWWMNDFEPIYAGTGPARFHAPTLAEMREYRPSPPQSADLSTLLGILIGRIKGDDKKSR